MPQKANLTATQGLLESPVRLASPSPDGGATSELEPSVLASWVCSQIYIDLAMASAASLLFWRDDSPEQSAHNSTLIV